MSQPCTVLIAAADLLPALKESAGGSAGEVLAFTDSDALRALEAITRRRPGVVVLERLFAASPRGAALINRIKADPTLTDSEIRVLSHDGETERISLRTAGGGGAVSAVATAPAAAPVAAPPDSLDQRGTRRAQRFVMAGQVDALVDGSTVTLVDLSICGAQVVSPTILRPNQRVRLVLTDDQGAVRLSAAVAWASFEIPPGSAPRYRAGLALIGADAASVEAYCTRHKG